MFLSSGLLQMGFGAGGFSGTQCFRAAKKMATDFTDLTFDFYEICEIRGQV
jgi:hypothetical protein